MLKDFTMKNVYFRRYSFVLPFFFFFLVISARNNDYRISFNKRSFMSMDRTQRIRSPVVIAN